MQRALLLPMLLAAASPAPASELPPAAMTASGITASGSTTSWAGSGTAEGHPAVAGEPTATDELRIGPYRLLEELGRGSMGVVWLAEQTEPFPRQVALKILRPDRVDARSVGWFESELQAMASVEHEHVARLHDAGTTASGLPWLAMELVPGEPVTSFCTRHHLEPGPRLQLFFDIADAVSHLHGRGVRHGDLKPENILVIERNGRAVAKIVDFGLSAFVGQSGIDDERLAGTPAYMAPEQFTLPGTAIDERADVFALGVVLHELLTDQRPEGNATIAEDGCLQVTIGGDSGAALRPHSRLRGGLAHIVGRALTHDRRDRYQSVAELTRDLRGELARHDRWRRLCRAGITVASAAVTGFGAAWLATL
ncbi:MAG: serine/threonine-protein kinase [Planctomycetota bacterium]